MVLGTRLGKGKGEGLVQIGWQHYNEKETRNLSVQLKRDRGTREISVPIRTSSGEVLPLLKEVYFPEGISTFGDVNVMIFKVANFKGEVPWQIILRSAN